MNNCTYTLKTFTKHLPVLNWIVVTAFVSKKFSILLLDKKQYKIILFDDLYLQ